MPAPHRPKLGQHFLASQRFRERIARALDLRQADLVVEIGAGRGALTELLAERARHVVAIELDPSLAGELKEKFRSDPRVEILHADVLSTDIAGVCRRAGQNDCLVFGNLPYYITSPILNHLFTFRTSIRGMALLVQREVAERITARPGTRDYGYLSVLVHLYSQPRLLFSVPPGAFSPPPKVQSALVDFRMSPQFPKWNGTQEEDFLNFVGRCFAHKRKNLSNNLSPESPRSQVVEALGVLEIEPNARAEQLSLGDLGALHNLLKPQG